MCRFGGAGVRLRNRGKTESRAVEYCASARLSAAYDSDITHTQGSNSASGGARASAVQVASHGAACAQVQQGGVFAFAALHGLRAAGVKAATRGRVHCAGHFPHHDGALARRLHDWVGHRHGGQQRLCIGV